MAFRAVQTIYDEKTGRAYVELREADGAGGETIVTAIFTYRTARALSNAEIRREMSLMAKHALLRAAGAA
jgi:hypothetical protein